MAASFDLDLGDVEKSCENLLLTLEKDDLRAGSFFSFIASREVIAGLLAVKGLIFRVGIATGCTVGVINLYRVPVKLVCVASRFYNWGGEAPSSSIRRRQWIPNSMSRLQAAQISFFPVFPVAIYRYKVCNGKQSRGANAL